MSTKLNVPLFMFALMIQCIIVGMVFLMPADVKATMTGYVEPTFPDIGLDLSDIPNPNLIDILVMIYLVVVYFIASIVLLVGYFLAAPLWTIGLMPFILQVTVGSFLLAIDLLVVFDIVLVLKGLSENITIPFI